MSESEIIDAFKAHCAYLHKREDYAQMRLGEIITLYFGDHDRLKRELDAKTKALSEMVIKVDDVLCWPFLEIRYRIRLQVASDNARKLLK